MANKVAVVTDSTASIPAAIVEELKITVTPNVLVWKGKSYLDGVDIHPGDFYEKLKSSSDLPTTSQSPPNVIGGIFDGLLAEGYDVLAILLSQKLSGTYQSGILAQSEREKQRITILDSKMSGMGMGWIAMAAARAALNGDDLAECTAVAKMAMGKVGVLGMVDTLKYLHRGGRIGGARRFLGTALNVKPLLEIIDGEIQGLEQVRTRRKALNRMMDLVEERIAGRTPVSLAVMHANSLDIAQKVYNSLFERVSPAESFITELSPALGANFGEGTVGVCYMAGF